VCIYIMSDPLSNVICVDTFAQHSRIMEFIDVFSCAGQPFESRWIIDIHSCICIVLIA
jgi:hypothetical protein